MINKTALIKKAIAASKLAYAPYSKFKVGAAILTKNNKIFLGANIENSAFSSTLCAERVAIANAYINGVRKGDIVAMAIVADIRGFISPCGECRQIMSEMFPLNTKIYLGNLNGKVKETTVSKLLPANFSLK